MPGVSRTELEGKVIGAILLRSDALYELPATLTDAVFSQGVLARVFRAIGRQGQALPQGALDPAAVLTWAGLDGDGARDMLDKAAAMATGCNLASVAAALLDQHRRQGATALLTSALEGFRAGEQTEDVIAKVATEILDLDRPGAPETSTATEAMLDALDGIEQCQIGGGRIVRSGFPDLDARLKMRPGNLIVLAARPGVGKTTLAFNIACNVAKYRSQGEGKRVLIHSLEMDRAELSVLALSRATRIDSMRFVEEKRFSADEWSRVSAEGDRIGRNANLIYNTQYPGLAAIASITRKEHRRSPLALVVVDYLQLVENQKRNGTRENEVSGVSGTLKRLAQELTVPILALSQFNREPEKRAQPKPKGRRDEPPAPALLPPPKMHELRESGAIEQDANAVVILHNPHADSADEYARAHGPFDVIIAKQRLGKKGTVQMLMDPEYCEFKPFQRSMRDVVQGQHYSETEGAP